MATTAFCNSAKKELLQSAHCLNGTVTPTGNTTSGSASVASVSSVSGVAVGMGVTGTGIPAGTVVAAVGTSTITLSQNATATGTGVTLTITGDVLKILLIKASPARTFDGTQTNVGTPGTGTPGAANIGTDETSGTGYTSGGVTLGNVTPSLSGTTGITTFSPNPSWTSASFSTTAAIIYNASARAEGATGRTISVHDFGGTQTVTNGTLTLIMPTAAAGTAILQVA